MKLPLIFGILLFGLLSGHVTAEMSFEEQWIEVNADAEFGPRQNHEVVAFDDRLWVIGGISNGNYTNDVWSSQDGKTWELEIEHAEFSPRCGHRVASFNNRLWVIGGLSEGTAKNDVWSSYDGKNWKLVTEGADFDPRFFHAVAIFQNRIWVIGGSNAGGATQNDVWFSSDGKTWILETEHAGFVPRHGHGAAVFQNRIWVIGGYSCTIDAQGNTVMQWLNDVWSSSNGCTWTLNNSGAAFEPREFVPVSTMDNTLWIPGGGGPTPLKTPKVPGIYAFNSIWTSTDGDSWMLDSEHAGFTPRYAHGVTSYAGGLWVIGGCEENGVEKNDVWYKAFHSPPSASLISNATCGTAPLSVEFTDASHGMINNWRWDFGDGTSATTRNVTHVFLNPGSYPVVLTVSGPDGTNQTMTTIVVDAVSVTPTKSGPNPALICIGIFLYGVVACGLRWKKN